jgi:hypothetical protein
MNTSYPEAIMAAHRHPHGTIATGDTLRAMFADLLIAKHGGDARTAARFYYPHLCRFVTDDAVRAEGEALLADASAAQDVIFRTRPTPA